MLRFIMWKKNKHAKFVHYWINDEKKIMAGLDRSGRFVMWTETGNYDSVQCNDVNDAISIMDKISGFSDSSKRNE